jgi:hypothetical protein
MGRVIATWGHHHHHGHLLPTTYLLLLRLRGETPALVIRPVVRFFARGDLSLSHPPHRDPPM